MKQLRKAIIYTTLGILSTFPLSLIAAGIQVSPSKLQIQETKSAQLVVANPTGNVLLFEIYPDEFKENIKINPESFTLEAGARKTITVENIKKTTGTLVTNISVVSRALADSELQANTGVKIPLIIEQGKSLKNPYEPFLVIASILLAGIIIKLLLNFLSHKKD